MTKPLIIAILAGAVSGLLFVSLKFESTLGMLFINFTHLPLFLAGFGLGTLAVAVAALTSTVVVGAAFEPYSAIQFAVVYAIPATLIVRQTLLRRPAADGGVVWYPSGRVLGMLVGYGLVTFAIIFVIMSGGEHGLVDVMRAALEETTALFFSALDAEQRLALADQWSTALPGALITSWLITLGINAAIAQGALTRIGKNRRPSLDLGRIELPIGFAFALVASGALWYIADGNAAFVGQTLTIAIATPYLFLGLAVVHQISRPWPGRPFALFLFYLLLLFLLGLPGLVLVAGLGLADQLIGLRRRVAGAAPDEEDE
jgi:hypothetical protein